MSAEFERGGEKPEEPLGIFINDLAETFPEYKKEIVVTAAKVLENDFGGQLPSPEHWALFYDRIAGEVTGVSLQLAAELFGRAYDTERPYKPNKPAFAINFIHTYYRFVNETKNFEREQLEWVADRKTTLEEASECIQHFWALEVYREGHRQAPKNPNDEKQLAGEWDKQALSTAEKFHRVRSLAQSLLTGPLKFI